MKLLKIIGVIFLIYFIRRFIQMYRVMKSVQEQQMKNQSPPRPSQKDQNVINAEYKVME